MKSILKLVAVFWTVFSCLSAYAGTPVTITLKNSFGGTLQFYSFNDAGAVTLDPGRPEYIQAGASGDLILDDYDSFSGPGNISAAIYYTMLGSEDQYKIVCQVRIVTEFNGSGELVGIVASIQPASTDKRQRLGPSTCSSWYPAGTDFDARVVTVGQSPQGGNQNWPPCDVRRDHDWDRRNKNPAEN